MSLQFLLFLKDCPNFKASVLFSWTHVPFVSLLTACLLFPLHVLSFLKLLQLLTRLPLLFDKYLFQKKSFFPPARLSCSGNPWLYLLLIFAGAINKQAESFRLVNRHCPNREAYLTAGLKASNCLCTGQGSSVLTLPSPVVHQLACRSSKWRLRLRDCTRRTTGRGEGGRWPQIKRRENVRSKVTCLRSRVRTSRHIVVGWLIFAHWSNVGGCIGRL